MSKTCEALVKILCIDTNFEKYNLCPFQKFVFFMYIFKDNLQVILY